MFERNLLSGGKRRAIDLALVVGLCVGFCFIVLLFCHDSDIQKNKKDTLCAIILGTSIDFTYHCLGEYSVWRSIVVIQLCNRWWSRYQHKFYTPFS